MRQDWAEEARAGFKQSKLANQCNYRYKIYAEGYAWSVSLKYIIACGSLSLIIHPQYKDFLSRGLMRRKNYWLISPTNLCPSIKFAVDWGNEHPLEFVILIIVPGRDACEIAMVHQEDAGLNVEMAKLAFAKGIWSYVCKMDNALHKYPPTHRIGTNLAVTALQLIQKVHYPMEAFQSVPIADSKMQLLEIHAEG
ncbi:uncharacterized protein LOC131227732 isoform X1 [Magnolia sinica]|uniref:uncharacterized protein LOC131227732 isoform X1 n=1 Tax=Magnolia sinica TaxID=86752 RepID=UPI00265A303C|nr:uncharacterized protein LOC131227732 isoform X1 [Magnolia sinica]